MNWLKRLLKRLLGRKYSATDYPYNYSDDIYK